MPLQCVRFVKMSTENFFLSNYTGYRSSEAWETSENIKRKKKGVFSSVGVTTMVLPSLKNLTYTTRDSIKQLSRNMEFPKSKCFSNLFRRIIFCFFLTVLLTTFPIRENGCMMTATRFCREKLFQMVFFLSDVFEDF